MKVISKPIYYCEHCSKRALTKHTIAKHEPICFGNPENIPPCFNGCEHLEKLEDRSFYCKNFKTKVHTKGAEVYKLTERYPEQFEGSTLMPKHCFAFSKPEGTFLNIFGHVLNDGESVF